MPPQVECEHESAARQRLRYLQAANRSIISELSLNGVLRRIVDAARDVSGAEYAALGVLGPDGALEEMIHAGMNAETVRGIAELPKGRGLLGALIKQPEPIRLDVISRDPRSAGFPTGHPPMAAFLGVPIRSRDTVFGNLYLTRSDARPPFTAEDEDLVLALAATAGIAIENARLYEDSRMTQEWLRASGEISRQLLAFDGDKIEVLRNIAISIRGLLAADLVSVVLPAENDPSQLEVAVAVGINGDILTGFRYAKAGSVAGRAIQTGRGMVINDVEGGDNFLHLRSVLAVTQAMAIPLKGERDLRGAVVVGRLSSRPPFTQSTLEMAEAFALQAAILLDLADSAERQRLSVIRDRDRIARDLHDRVIQRLFATGMSLEGMAGVITDPGVRSRMARAVDDLDDSIRQIRSSIFSLQDSRPEGTSVRAAVMMVLDQVSPLLGFHPRCHLAGPLDTLTDDEMVVDVEAVLREALTNVAKHAYASDVQVDVIGSNTHLRVVIVDNGVGLNQPNRNSGLGNLHERAQRRHGTLTLDNQPEGGLRVQWVIPLTL